MGAPEMSNRWEGGAAWDTVQRMEVKNCFKRTKYFVVFITADRKEKKKYLSVTEAWNMQTGTELVQKFNG